MEEKILFSPKQVAQELGLRYGQVMRRIRSNKIEAIKIDWGWVITQEEVDRLKGEAHASREIST